MANNKEIAEIKLIESEIKLNDSIEEHNNLNNIQSTILQKTKQKFDFSTKHGRLGLKNLGNTCYMNCALQVMAHTKELVSYMMIDYQQEILNKHFFETNEIELLYKRQILSEFANIVKEEWTSTRNEAIVPKEFKNKFISIYNQFDNTCQQDAHEFLTCFLNTLHESLLRIDNITTEQPMPFSRNLSNICWENHIKFNGESFITDIFFGQLKSTIKCENCLYESNVYEAFDCLGLTTPKEFRILLYFVPLDKNHKPTKMFVKVNDAMQYRNILNIVKSQVEYEFDTGIFYYVFNNKLSQIVSLEERSGDLLNRNLFLFLIETTSVREKINCNQIYENTFICLNTFMIEDQTNKKVENLKEASFPRIFSLYNLLSNQSNPEFDDQALVKFIIEYILNFIKTYISTNDIFNEFKDLYENELVALSIKSVRNIQKDEDAKQICLLCEREEMEEFNCYCINKNIPNLYSINFNQNNYSYLIYYFTNRKMDSEFILTINVSIDKTKIRYREINSCCDQTKKIIPDTNLKLVDLFDYYTAEEKLTSQDDFKCQSCLNNVAYKKLEINKFPEILCLNLKRFRYDSSSLLNSSKTRTSRRGDYKGGNFKGEKIETFVEFPMNNLDLSKYSNKGKVVYELYAVCNHEGKIDSGHYTAVCKHPSSAYWIEYNDEKTPKNVQNTDIPTSEAYLLFYRKRK